MLAGHRWRGWDLVFCTSIGTPLDVRNLQRHWKAMLHRAGLADRRWQDLRHTCATLMLAGGVSPRVMQEVPGHGHIGMTLGTNSHVLPSLRREAADRMEAILARDNGSR